MGTGIVVPPPSFWSDLIDERIRNRPRPIEARTYIETLRGTSNPVVVTCRNGIDYVVKGTHLGRVAANEQTVAHLALAIAAPVPEPAQVEISSEFIAANPVVMRDFASGVHHGSRYIPGLSDRSWIMNDRVPLNRVRFARLAVLYGWAYAKDHQVQYEHDPPHLVYSVDHGNFFPALHSSEWTLEDLRSAPPAEVDARIVGSCGLGPVDISPVIQMLAGVQNEAIAHAVALSPASWGISMDERIGLAIYLAHRQLELVASAAEAA